MSEMRLTKAENAMSRIVDWDDCNTATRWLFHYCCWVARVPCWRRGCHL